MLEWVAAAIIGYLLGSIPVGFLVAKSKGVDIRKYGSGATGGTNVLRTLGVVPALATGLTDLLKGLVGAYIGGRLGGDWGYAVGGFFAVVGHSYPVWLKFKGGKSVATSAGSMILLYPLAFLAGLAAAIAAIVPTRYVSLGSLIGALVYPGIIIFTPGAPQAHKALALGAALVVYIRHWENIKRIAAGTENKLGQKAKPKAEH
ncbi:MAG TPA: glycerol-3-phosphate 1-O-acyltransferase PlsY [Symbiobacteriaceae bacterium]|nr:glycerol-3-phosphate 1-O-acyltransferase PlsY [Symbiobacteriaceae bacterium]